jgi:membrane fusion protein (multidrug efflux system)
MADLHPGQYLNEGTELTTLQGIDDAAHVDFTVAQQVAAGLREGDSVEVSAAGQPSPITAKIVAVDARIDPTTRNAMVRARIEGAANAPSPGSSVRVRVSVGLPRKAVTVPASAMRKGPGGDQVFVIEPDKNGKTRAHVRQVEGGAMIGDEVVIHAGLSAGERVAVSGSFKLREAALVAIAGSPEDKSGSDQMIVGER